MRFGNTGIFAGICMLLVRSVAAGKTMAGCGPLLRPSLNSIFSKSRKCHRRRVW
jgi:hypothetical protein